MSRLDSFIRRLEAQRACLNHLTHCIDGLDGIILELGLGNGRTYDHIRSTCPGREIFVFEREVRAHPDCIPEDKYLILGDIFETLPAFLARAAGRVAMVHSDVGSGDAEHNKMIAARLSEILPAALAPGGMIACDQPLDVGSLNPVDLPPGVPENRYFLYRKPA